VGLLRAIARLEGRTLTSRDLLAGAQQWRPWRAYAAQHLWASTSSDRVIERSGDRVIE
jgi:3-methyladenine DNA glycosylase/8-oxoguanine DNA glycosylase